MQTDDWNRFSEVQPEKGKKVDVIYHDGLQINECTMAGNLVICPDGNYRYVDPVFWRYSE